jgi:hypothetical protein
VEVCVRVDTRKIVCGANDCTVQTVDKLHT